ncbi:hypothetical protein RQP54_18410 [Curvibacter sp. APW13]|uniref:hypothetical protein n=1 Tax=Curvibacter sp. APW13 TaxID=3077236 RepID=UPI0028DEDEAC|nr:hypothetical protein [Curvibacter sp. APW13]MDT8992853.1 hypothetical protein [Curvibacter sp. APW13]
MIRQIASLSILTAAVLSAVAVSTVDQDRVAARLLTVHGPQKALEIAQTSSTSSALMNLVPSQVYHQWIYLVAGVLVGVIARFAVANWAKQPKVDAASKVSVTDEAGGRYTMHGVPFAHAPHAPKLVIADVSDVPGIEAASLIEVELLGAYRAGGRPADVDGYHGVSLFEHCLSTWRKAVETNGPCTLEAILALAHDAGKLITFVPANDGAWKRLSPKHESYNAEVVRRLPSFFAIPKEERDLLMLALGYMEGDVAAKDVPDVVVTAVEHVHILDIKATSTEVQERRAGEVDTSQLIRAVIDLAKSPPEDWNVNRSQSSSAPAGAIHLQDGLLLVAGRAMRAAIAKRVDAATSATLGLQLPSTEWHQSYEEIAAAVQKAGLGQRIVNNVASSSGWFSLRVGAAKIPHAIAIKTQATPATQGLWGVNQLEIVVSEAKK